MRLVYICSVCKQQNFFKPKVDSRAKLQMMFGDEVKVNCNNCGKFDKKHLNRISAVVDQRLVIGGFLLGLGIVLFSGIYLMFMSQIGLALWKTIAVVGGTIAGIPVFLWNRENTAVGNFNRYAIKR